MASGTVTATSNKSNFESRIVWSSSSNGASANTSNVYAELQGRRNDGYTTTGTWSWWMTLGSTNKNGTIHTSIGSSWVKLASMSIVQAHEDSGKGSCYLAGEITGPSGTSMSSLHTKGTATVTLDTIARYLTINSFKIQSRSINTAVVSWSASNARDYTYYSLNGGEWTGSSTYGETVASDNKSGTFNIKNLTPNTTYTLKIKVRRTDSGLYTESSTISFTTYDYGKLSSVPNVNIGSSQTITWTNPRKRNAFIKTM